MNTDWAGAFKSLDWAQTWKYVAWAAIWSYFGLGVAITIGGFFDVIKMFRRLEDEHAQRSQAENHP